MLSKRWLRGGDLNPRPLGYEPKSEVIRAPIYSVNQRVSPVFHDLPRPWKLLWLFRWYRRRWIQQYRLQPVPDASVGQTATCSGSSVGEP